MAQLRTLGSDVWNGVRFFLTINAALLAGIAAIGKPGGQNVVSGALLVLLCTGGFVFNIWARQILLKQRRYYLRMLAQKAFLDKELGFRDFHHGSSDLSFPWSVSEKDLVLMESDINSWIDRTVRAKSSITRNLFSAYHTLLGLYFVLLLAVALGFYRGYFPSTPLLKETVPESSKVGKDSLQAPTSQPIESKEDSHTPRRKVKQAASQALH